MASDVSSSPSSGILSISTQGSYQSSFEDSSDGDDDKRSSVSKTRKRSGPRSKRGDDDAHVWKWWEHGKDNHATDGGNKWRSLEHNGPVFPPPYKPLPSGVNFYYNGRRVKLSPEAEEVATFYAKMLNHEYTKMDIFNRNFFNDWRDKFMTNNERNLIKDLKKCDFDEIHDYFNELSEKKKNMSKEEKKKAKDEQEKINQSFGYCLLDGRKQKIGNFRIEPPGLFRGRGHHPKMGKVKERIEPEDVTINIGKDAKVPRPPTGHKWKEVIHDNSVTWLASWTENIMKNTKYIMLNSSSKLNSIKDYQKYELARKLHSKIKEIRDNYHRDFDSSSELIRQRAVAIYFIDKLALRAGNEKNGSNCADTVGCCSLRVEHIRLINSSKEKFTIHLDFNGKDSIRYNNKVQIEKKVFNLLQEFIRGKDKKDNLFDRLTTSSLNKYLNTLMNGLTAKVFRTYNASITLQKELDARMRNADRMSLQEKVLAYNRANRSVAVLCNHQRAIPKGFEKQMETIRQKIESKEEQIEEAEDELEEAETEAAEERARNKLNRLNEQLDKLKVQEMDKEENKDIALGTSKLNYIDPRITVAWCKRYNVSIDKVYSKTHREKFRWAIEMIQKSRQDYRFDRRN